MEQTKIDEALYNKYIRPTQRRRRRYVGIEIEMPLVNEDPAPVDFGLVHALTDAFVEAFDFRELHRDDEGEIYLAVSAHNGDGISYDCSYNTLELSFGLEEDINVLSARFRRYVDWVQDFLRPHRHLLTGMGINPRYQVNRSEPVPTGRYRMLFHHLESYKKYGDQIPFHNVPNFGMFSCASQVQLDVEEGMLPQVLHTFSKLEPLKAVLFSNSLYPETPELLCSRDRFWKYSLHGLNPHNVDMYETELDTTGELLEYIKSMSLFCAERGDQYLNFPPLPVADYLDGRTVTGEYYDGTGYRTRTFRPELGDIAWLRSYKFVDVTFRGTIEFRSVCCQPLGEAMAPAAFHAGLMEVLPDLEALLDRDTVLYHRGYNASELRELLVRRRWPSFVDREELSRLLLQVLDLADRGLSRRGLGEEPYLDCLYRRAETLKNPASRMAEGLEAGAPLEQFIYDYARQRP